MTLLGSRLSSSDWTTIEQQLDDWFSERHSRQSLLPFRTSQISEELALCACALFKRGAAGIVDSDTGRELPLPVRAMQFSTQTGAPFESWQDFLHATINATGDVQKYTVIVDRRVADLHPSIERTCSAACIPVIRFDCHEDQKNLGSARNLYEQITHDSDTLIIVGGGICCDVAAFVGGLLNLKLILVPSTLLALVDAGLGGKTGVNHPRAGKNQIGVFANIAKVIIVTELLTSLPRAAIDDGIGEIMKHAWLSGQFGRWKPAITILLNTPSSAALQNALVQKLIRENIEFKKSIVAADPFEHNLRILLNLGHTVAHLLEGLTLANREKTEAQQHLSHGVAVALGLQSLIASGLLQGAPEDFVEILDLLKKRSGIVFPMFRIAEHAHTITMLLNQDKKNITRFDTSAPDNVRCVLPVYGVLNNEPVSRNPTELLGKSLKLIPNDIFLTHLKNTGIIQ